MGKPNKSIKVPVFPAKPKEPRKPEEYIDKHHEIYIGNEEIVKLTDVKNLLPTGSTLDDVYFQYEYLYEDSYGECGTYACKLFYVIKTKNENYEKEMEKYLSQMDEYHIRLIEFHLKEEKYRKEYAEYIENKKENELAQAEEELKKAQKKVKELKKKSKA